MRTKAAILVEAGKPLVIDEIEIPALKKGQVLVEIQYSGICHTQILEARGYRGNDPFLPHLLGHEGSGVVKEIGEGVTKVKKEDRVILSWMKGSGQNVLTAQYEWNNKKVNSGAITTFSRVSIISENRLTLISSTFPLKAASLLGCALPTGLGSVFNCAKPSPGQSIAIFGCGGIGLSAIQGARIAGCSPIIAIDIYPQKLQIAKEVGATHTLNAKEENFMKALEQLGAIDFAIEASGSPMAMQQAIKSVHGQGGLAVIIGNAKEGEILKLDPKELNNGKRIFGSWGGDNTPDIHFPRYCKLVESNHINLNHFLEKIYSLDNVNQALLDLEEGRVLRPIIDLAL